MFNGKKKEIGMKYAVKKDFYTLNSIPFSGGDPSLLQSGFLCPSFRCFLCRPLFSWYLAWLIGTVSLAEILEVASFLCLRLLA